MDILSGCRISVSKGLEEEDSSDGSAVVGGVVGEACGRGENGLISGLERRRLAQQKA